MLKLVYNHRGDVKRFEGNAFCLRPRGAALDVYSYRAPKQDPLRIATFSKGALKDLAGNSLEPHRIQLVHAMERADAHDRLYAGFAGAAEALHVENDSFYLQAAPQGLIELRSSAFHLGISYDKETGCWSDMDGSEGELYIYGHELADEEGALIYPFAGLGLLESPRLRLSDLAAGV